jgi:hypothetical protein
MFQRLCKDGNVLISIDEMSAEDMVRKLHIIEQSPTVIWEALQNNFGFGFFNKIIEGEYGITPDF